MALKHEDREKFDLIVGAAKRGNLTLVESKDAKTGEYRAVLAATFAVYDGFEIYPIGHLNPNAIDDYVDPHAAMEQDNDCKPPSHG